MIEYVNLTFEVFTDVKEKQAMTSLPLNVG